MVIDPMKRGGIASIIKSIFGVIFYDPRVDNTPRELSKKVRKKKKNEKRN